MKLAEVEKTEFRKLKSGQYFKGPYSSIFYRADSNAGIYILAKDGI